MKNGSMAADPQFELYCLVDSIEGVKRLVSACKAQHAGRPVNLLLECGYIRGRAGSRSIDSAMELAEAIKESPEFLQLVGIEAL
jgi:D-serine dehydratase